MFDYGRAAAGPQLPLDGGQVLGADVLNVGKVDFAQCPAREQSAKDGFVGPFDVDLHDDGGREFVDANRGTPPPAPRDVNSFGQI